MGKHQSTYYQSINSLRSSRRWATAIIRKLHLIAWDMWDHRNAILHSAQNANHNITHQRLNLLIWNEHQQGLEGLESQDRHWIRAYPLHLLYTQSIETKQLWLDSICWARMQYDPSEQQAQRSLEQQRRTMQQWLQN